MKLYLKILIIIVFGLMLLGSIMVFTASGTYSLSRFDNLYALFRAHLWKVFIAIGLMIYFAGFQYDNYRKISKWALIGIIAVLVLTLIIAPKVKGAARWIDLGILKFQPSEAAKMILIIHLAMMVEKLGDKIKNFKEGFIYPLIWISIVCLLVIMQPNVSTSLIIVITSFAILYVGGANLKHILIVFITAGTAVGSIIMLFQHSRERVFTYINSLITGSDINIQVKQAKIALGSGGLTGLGLGQSRQSDLFLPESFGDFIFSILGEELGFIGAASVLICYLLLFVFCLIIAKKSQDRFGQLLVFGLSFNIIISAMINAGVVTGLLPTTGITLPFISFGGTSIIILGISVGIIINVARVTLKTEDLRIAQVG